MTRFAAVALVAVLALLTACGDDDEVATLPPSVSSPPIIAVTPTLPVERRDPCALLAATNVADTLGIQPGRVIPHEGPGTLRFCTVYLEAPGCQGQCALSLEDLGLVSENTGNTSEAFRRSIETANEGSTISFEDGVLGENSWLATISTTDLPEWRLLYFQVGGVAYDFGSPRVPSYQPTSEQMIALGQAAIDNLQ